jgi:hypothetical protein
VIFNRENVFFFKTATIAVCFHKLGKVLWDRLRFRNKLEKRHKSLRATHYNKTRCSTECDLFSWQHPFYTILNIQVCNSNEGYNFRRLSNRTKGSKTRSTAINRLNKFWKCLSNITRFIYYNVITSVFVLLNWGIISKIA